MTGFNGLVGLMADLPFRSAQRWAVDDRPRAI